MPRKPFDPSRAAGAEPALFAQPAKRGDEPVSVAAVSELIKQVVTDAMPPRVRVIGQISNLSNRQHWFFSLKDEQATLRCVCFASSARRIRFPVEDGMEVIASGRIDYYPAQGQLQLYVDSMEPVGQGALDAKYKALCEELRKLGYFDPSRKKPLPFMPQRIAVVTSRSAAALQDVRDTAARRWGGVELLLYDVRVQGEAAAPQIAAAIETLSEQGEALGIEAIILTRGGGSIEDLWAFNERIVADAVYNCTLPIVAAIGHETDTTIAELVADMRCATPTQAATALVPEREALQHQVAQLSGRLTQRVRREMAHHRQRLNAIARHRMFREPRRMLEPIRQRVDHLARYLTQTMRGRVDEHRSRVTAAARHPFFRMAHQWLEPNVRRLDEHTAQLQSAMRRRMTHDAETLAHLDRQLQAIGPRAVLERGYTYTLDAKGNVLRRAADAKPGDALMTVLSDGKVSSRVEGKAPKRKSRKDDDAPSLFDE